MAATITSLTIENGHLSPANPGAGIYNSGTLTLADVTISGNTATQFGAYGGGIYNGTCLAYFQ